MSSSLLAIKTTIPPLDQQIVSRSRIIEHLNSAEAARSRLTLISAPAGFGKTTAAREWIAGREQCSAWYSLDEGDNDRMRFWVYLITALQTFSPKIGVITLETARSAAMNSVSDAGSEYLLTGLLNDLFALEDDSVVVLDDYHVVDHPPIHRDMQFFIENLPPQLHLVITTRSEPPWPLSRWRAKGFMAEIRQRELTFSPEETQQLLVRVKGLVLKESLLLVLHRKTEGWAAGLQLASYSLSRSRDPEAFIRSFAGSHRHVFHFLSEEVLSSQSPEVQQFLMEISVLERFCGSLCDAVTGRCDGHEMLADLERKNLFAVSLDDHGEWYRYHPLFADLLLVKLKQDQPDRVSQLHRRAARWFFDRQAPGEAVRHAALGEDLEFAASLLQDHIEEVLNTDLRAGGGGPMVLMQMLERFADEHLMRFPLLIPHKAWLYLIHKGREEAQAVLDLADQAEAQAPPSRLEEFRGMQAVVRAYSAIYAQDMGRAAVLAEEALKLLPVSSNYWHTVVAVISGDARLFTGSPEAALQFYSRAYRNNKQLKNHYLVISNGFKTATALYFMGNLEESRKITEEMLELAKRQGFSRFTRTGLLWVLLGELLREQGDLEEAQRCIERGLFLSRPEHPSYGWNCLFKAALMVSKLDYDGAMEAVREIEALNQKVALPIFVNFPAACWKARILLAQQRGSEARNVLTSLGITPEAEIIRGKEFGFIVLARLLAAEETAAGADRAAEILETVVQRADAGTYRKLQTEALLVHAALEEQRGNRSASARLLERSKELKRECGFFQLFADENRLQKKAASAEAEPRGEKSLQYLVEELTGREREVLELISLGLSNQEISQRMFLSVGTVKWHTSNIYGKLGVRSRTEALVRADRLGLLKPRIP